MGQHEQIIQMLEAAGDRGVSSTDFYNAYIPRFPARLFELKERGYPIEDEREGRFKRWFLRRSDCGGPGNSVSDVAAGPSNDLRTESALSLAGPGATAQMPCQDHGRTGGDHSSSSVPCLPGGGRSEVGEASVTAISRCLNPYEYEAEEAA